MVIILLPVTWTFLYTQDCKKPTETVNLLVLLTANINSKIQYPSDYLKKNSIRASK